MIKRRISLYLLIAAVLIAVAGCGSTTQSNENIKTQLTQLTGNFESAVESYNVTEMLACLSGDDFTLTIQEAGQHSIKTYAQLTGELQDDETNQLDWRKPAPDGYDYVLDLVLDTPQFDKVSSTGGIITRTFKVFEKADGIPETKTDNGVITWQVAQISGEWKATAMTIEYQPLVAEGLQFRMISRGGFGFTKLSL